MSQRWAVLVTANFERNLRAIERFLSEQEAPMAFEALLSALFDTVIPNLEMFAEMGTDFMARHPHSMEGLAQWKALKRRIGPETQLREYITGDHLVLYAVRDEKVFLLAIKHHRQLSFDLRGHW